MKKKTRKIIGIAIVLLIVTTIGIPVEKYTYENGHVKFADEIMRRVI